MKGEEVMRPVVSRVTFGLPVAPAAVLVVVLAAGCAPPAGEGAEAFPGITAPVSPSPSPSVTGVPPTPAPMTPAPATTSASPARATLRFGDRGPDVLAMQRRLVSLGYWLGEPDGVFGTNTRHAVTAFQKAAGLERDSVAGPRTLTALASASRPKPRSHKGQVVEVDVARQLLLVAVNGRADAVLDTSTGARRGTTPRGHFRVQREVDGYESWPPGMYRSKYFKGGVAVHGYPSVPSHPASHGCVRVTNAAMDQLWRTGALEIGARVWVY